MGRADVLKPGRERHGPTPIARAELPIDTAALALTLIGKLLVRELPEGVASGRIVETEAYIVGDAAGHAYRGMTPRNRSLFLERGRAYVYLAYGVSYMLNVSSETPVVVQRLAHVPENRAPSRRATGLELEPTVYQPAFTCHRDTVGAGPTPPSVAVAIAVRVR